MNGARTQQEERPKKLAWGLLRRRQVIAPTWRGWLVFLLLAAGASVFIVRSIYPFLTVNDSRPSGYLVVEGWAPDYALTEALKEFEAHPYQKLFTTGGPLETGAPLVRYNTYAELASAILLKLGANSNSLQAVPAPLVRQDRTYASAIALKKWFADQNMPVTNINVMTVGPHSRRTRMLFQKAFGKDVSVGIIAVEPYDYAHRDWWRSSEGFRGVTGELIAYFYARLLFHPAPADQ